ncbi:MAG: peptide chain release factor 1 [Ignavibacteriales bacterium]|jgi:bacterial peptide chain release factor 1 (bRF-1)|nr:MAG: peptide chain release factor 1 [Ignavibacteriaceae bacterium]MBW7872806.1 peptide chain release factor 1 [Ignavibacteria bacterium]MCZ2143525.1 peptide chain release factor 1 [Ignavibacteriales bacterium]MBV6444402.1 Peptide chain release factor 1 [Ignavibacteriaceae bacterium]MBZ0197207.1 peptide chain release factor 1 [Ignavibacteriaceae bacterium]
MDFFEKLTKIKEKFDRVNDQLAVQANLSDTEKLIALSKERSDLLPIMEVFEKYSRVIADLQESKDILENSNDKELVEIAEMEIDGLKEQKEALEEEIKVLLLPKDPNDDKSVIMEIRAGTGGDEAGLFAGDLLRMYNRYAEIKGWKTEYIDLNEAGGLGGIKEAVLTISGAGVYGELKWESGVHRVQRVPATEAQGRVHTSAASVAVLPEVEDVAVDINMSDVKIDVYRSGGAGGQNVNKVETAIRMTHIPTGIVVQCQDERSQLKNREKALKVLKARLYDLKMSEQNTEIAAQRKLMVKSGDRSDKIRTYNFPQNRVTDHRIGLTLYNLSDVIDGNLSELIEQLKIADRAEKLQAEA